MSKKPVRPKKPVELNTHYEDALLREMATDITMEKTITWSGYRGPKSLEYVKATLLVDALQEVIDQEGITMSDLGIAMAMTTDYYDDSPGISIMWERPKTNAETKVIQKKLDQISVIRSKYEKELADYPSKKQAWEIKQAEALLEKLKNKAVPKK